MPPIPVYSYKIAAGLNNAAGLVNVELMIAGSKYFAPPALDDDDILLQPLSSGEDFERGYTQLIWNSKVWRAQYAYLYTTVLGGRRSGPVTFQTKRGFDDTAYTIYDGYLRLPSIKQSQRNYNLFTIQWTFSRLRLITP